MAAERGTFCNGLTRLRSQAGRTIRLCGSGRVRPVSTLPVDGEKTTRYGTHRVMGGFSLAKFGRLCGPPATKAVAEDAGIPRSERY